MLPQKGNGAALSDHLRDDRHSGKWFIFKEIGHICTYRFRCSWLEVFLCSDYLAVFCAMNAVNVGLSGLGDCVAVFCSR